MKKEKEHFLVKAATFLVGLILIFTYIPVRRLYYLILEISDAILTKKLSKNPKDIDTKNEIDRLRKIYMSTKAYSGKSVFHYRLDRYYIGHTEQAHSNRVFIFFLLPTFTAFSVFVITPFIMGVYFSMTDWTGLNTGHQNFIGLQNYIGLFRDYQFFYSFVRTATYSLMNILVINVVAFGLALLVTQNTKLRNVYRAGFFLPNLIGGLVLGYIWQFIYNNALTSLGGAWAESVLAAGNNEHAMAALIIVVTWQYAGYIMMIYIAAIQNVPQDLIEASRIDGANAYQRFWNITFPLVAQAFTVSLFLTLVTSFKQFDTVISLTRGGPAAILPSWITGLFGLSNTMTPVKSLNLIAINIYNEAFVNYNMGIGQAKAVFFFIILLGISLLQVHYSKKREVEL